jgi:hypothetical protein
VLSLFAAGGFASARRMAASGGDPGDGGAGSGHATLAPRAGGEEASQAVRGARRRCCVTLRLLAQRPKKLS